MWESGTPVRWQNRERWWYGIVLVQEGAHVLVKATTKGDEQPYLVLERGKPTYRHAAGRHGGAVGWRHAEAIERDPDPSTDGEYSEETIRESLLPVLICCTECGAMRSRVIRQCFCGTTTTRAAPKPRTDALNDEREETS